MSAQRLIAFTASLAVVATLGCSDSPTRPRGTGLDLRLDLSSPSLPPGTPLTVAMTVTNLTAEPVKLTFPDSCQPHFQVLRSGTELWSSLANVLCLTVITHVDLAPGESFTYNAVWNQRDNDGRAVTPGTYVVRGSLRSDPAVAPREAAFTIQ